MVDTHKDSYMDTHNHTHKDSKVEIMHCQGSYRINLLKMAPQFQIQNQLHLVHNLCHNLCHNHRAYIVPSISPFLTYPIRDGRSEEGRMPMSRINYACVQCSAQNTLVGLGQISIRHPFNNCSKCTDHDTRRAFWPKIMGCRRIRCTCDV